MSSTWSMLPSDLLLSISDRLRCITDCIRFESVCTWWRHALAANRHLLNPSAPTAMIPGRSGTTHHKLFSVANGKKFRIHLPEIDGGIVVGASLGWLVVAGYRRNERRLCLLNPFTRSQIDLPLEPDWSFTTRLVLSFDPLSSDCSVMIIHKSVRRRNQSRLSFCKIDDDQWTDLDTDPEDYFEDVGYCRGEFYAVTDVRKVVQCCTGLTQHVMSIVAGPEYDRCNRIYLVESSSSGELSMVTLHVPRVGPDNPVTAVHVVDFGDASFRRMRSLGDENFYVGRFYGRTGHASSVKGSGEERNRVYFSDLNVKHWMRRTAPLNAGVFNMENSTMEPLFEEDFFDKSSLSLIWLNIDQS